MLLGHLGAEIIKVSRSTAMSFAGYGWCRALPPTHTSPWDKQQESIVLNLRLKESS
jgi:hypothetical protein